MDNPNANTPQSPRQGALGFVLKYKKWLMFAVGVALSAYFLWQSTRQVKLADFKNEMSHFNYWWLIPSFLAFYYSMYLRAVRWGLLFRPHHKLKGYQVFRPLMICFGFNCLLPGRVGEVARALIVGVRNKTGIPTALATVVSERIIDAATLIGMLAFSLTMLPPVDPKMSITQFGKTVTGADFNHYKQVIVKMSIVLVVGVVVFMLPLTQRILHGIIKRLPLLGPGIKKKLGHTLDHFAQGFHALREPWVLAQIIFHSLVLWVLIAVSNLALAHGFKLSMNLSQAVAQMVMIAIFIMIPAAPGYWGLFEAGAIFGLIVLGVVRAEQQSLALAFTLVVHLMQYLPLVLMGALFAWQLQVKPVPAEALAEEVEEPVASPSAK